jgi:hypothetical protein
LCDVISAPKILFQRGQRCFARRVQAGLQGQAKRKKHSPATLVQPSATTLRHCVLALLPCSRHHRGARRCAPNPRRSPHASSKRGQSRWARKRDARHAERNVLSGYSDIRCSSRRLGILRKSLRHSALLLCLCSARLPARDRVSGQPLMTRCS